MQAFNADKKIIALLNIKGLEEKLPAGQFASAHKSFIVPVARINTIEINMLA
jgi:DNA-binding LytR/AlgR family response regulator